MPVLLLLATVYTVAPAGSDAAAGTAGAPWQTIQHCAATAVAGDVCHVMPGTYRETVTPASTGTAGAHLRFEADASGCVIVSGADVFAPAWTQQSPSVWVAGTGKQFQQMFANGAMVNEARWPNADPADLVHMPMAQAGAGSDQNGIVLSDAPAGDWTHAMVLILPGAQWSSYTRQITAYDAGTRYATFDTPISSPSVMVPRQGSRYVLFGTLPALDAPGEWVLDASAQKVYVYGSSAPAGLEIKQRTFAFDTVGKEYVDIAGFQVFGAAIRVGNNTTVDGVRLTYPAVMRQSDATNPDVAQIAGDHSTWQNSVVEFSAASGILVNGNHNTVINNIVHDVDWAAAPKAGIEFPTYGTVTGNVVAHNTVSRSGWAGISMWTTQSRIVYNKVTDAALLTHDNGAFYVWNVDGQNTEVAWNEAARAPCFYCAGIYLDDGSKNYVVHHNFLHDLGWYGVTLKDQDAVVANTIVRAGRSPLLVARNAQNNSWLSSAALVFDNLFDEETQLDVIVTPAEVTDFTGYAAAIAAGPSWTHVTVPFASLRREVMRPPAPLDLAKTVRLDLFVDAPGAYDVQVDNVQLEGASPKVLSNFETGLGSSASATWNAGNGSGTAAPSLRLFAPGASCSAHAAELSGTQVLEGWQSAQLNLTADWSAYAGISFDVRAHSALQLGGPAGSAPSQGMNLACPMDANFVPIAGCALGSATAVAGYVAAGADLGAFPSGAAPWTAGASFTETNSCAAPSAGSFAALPAQAAFPAAPASVGAPALAAWSDTCAPPATDGGTPDAGSTPPPASGGHGGGCSTSGAGALAFAAIAASLLARRRRR